MISRVLLVIPFVMTVGLAYGETISVTAFGNGKTRDKAVEAGKQQALIDAFSSSSQIYGYPIKTEISLVSRYLERTKVVGVKKIGADNYEAEVEADVNVPNFISPEQRKRIALVGDLSNPERRLSSSTFDNLKELLSSSNQITVVDRLDPNIANAIAHIKSVKGSSSPESVKSGLVPHLDLLCVISPITAASRPGETTISPNDTKVRISFVDVLTGETKKVRTISTANSSNVAQPDGMAIGQIAKVILDYVSLSAMHSNSSRFVVVPTGAVKLEIGQSVRIYRLSKESNSSVAREVSIGLGEVISVGQSHVKVISNEHLAKSDSYIVKPATTPRVRGVVSDSDW